MFFKNLKYILRSFQKNKTFVIINLFGMTAGILVALLTGFYAYYQLSYDKFVKNHENIYRIEYITDYLGNVTEQATCSHNLANVLKAEVPGIEDIMVVQKVALNIQFDCEGNPIDLNNWLMVTRSFLDYHGIEFIHGTRDSGLENSKSLLITESMAKKYFADQDPIGKEFKFAQNNYTRFVITGVIKDLPPNSHIRADALALDSSQWPDSEQEDDYDPENLVLAYKYIYLILEENVSIDQILQHFPSIKGKHMVSYLEENGYDLDLTATNIAKTHFKQDLMWDLPAENINSIYYFLLVAFMVILISIINFINLSLARHTSRNTDIGIRKIIGATKAQIFWQYLSESFLFIIISFVLALIIFYLVLPSFASFNGLELIGVSLSSSGLFILIPFLLIVGFLAGFYPALITASKNPQLILQNKNAGRTHKGNRVFVIIQIILSIVFFIGTMTIFMQIQFVNKIDKGYDLENVIAYEYYNYGSDMPSCAEICEMLKKSAYINDVAVSTKLPGQDLIRGKINVDLSDQTIKLETGLYHIDENYLPFMEIDLLCGRNFDRNLAIDSEKVIVNEAFARTFGTPENVIGTRVYYQKEIKKAQKLDAEIIGVVRNFHFQSMHHKIAPLLLISRESAPNFYHIKYDPLNLKFVLEDAQQIFDALAAKHIFAAKKYFPEEELIRQYETEKHLSEMTIWLAMLSILMAILGVFGLTAFVVHNNMKMLCIRKVFGAERKDLFKLMLRDYSIVLLISNIIALPLAWFVCIKWLQRFAYHISLSFWLYAAGIVMSLLIVIISIIYHVSIVSKADPVEYLQDE